MTVQVALVGFGLAGRILHAPPIRSAQMRISSVVTSQATLVSESLPEAKVYASLDEVLRRESVDLVVIASPNHLHVSQAEAALRAGKHVVIDKPFALSGADADRLLALANDRSRSLSVFHNRRWDSDFLTLRGLIESGQLGDIHYAQLRWDRFRPQVTARWREQASHGGGVLFDLGTHLIDQALTLFGRPEWLQADVFSQRSGGAVDDGFEILLGRGLLRISLGASSMSAGDGTRYRIYGSKACWTKRGLDIQESQLRGGMDPLAAEFGVEPRQAWGNYTENDSGEARVTPALPGCWLQFYREVVQSVESGAPSSVDPRTARQVIQIIDASFQSSREKRRVLL